MDEFFNITENELVLGDGKEKYTVLHISDTHVCFADELSTEEERRKSEVMENAWTPVKEGFAHYFGEPFNDSHRIPTADAFLKLVEYAKCEKPDLLVLSGDILDYMHPAGERLLKKTLEDYGGEYICVPGNHEEATLDGVWNGITVKDFGKFSVVGIDDRNKTLENPEMLSALKKVVNTGKPIIAVFHVPIATEKNREAMKKFSDYYILDFEFDDVLGREFVSLLEKSENVKLILCGHVHGYNKSEFANGRYQVCASQGMGGFVHKLTVKI